MFIVVSDNLESYEDHHHDTILICATEEDAKEATNQLRAWLGRASIYLANEWERFAQRDHDAPCDQDAYCLVYDQYIEKIEPLPIQVHIDHFPNGSLSALDANQLEEAITYYEVPFWAK